ncbi:MAG: signal peptidase I [Chloroflexota bacterium]
MIEKVSYRFQTPSRGDIVVIKVPHSDLPLIKRVIGLPGEVIEIKGDAVFADGYRLPEPYLTDDSTTQQSRYTTDPILIPAGHIFVMGDNREASNDSRAFGPINMDAIVGRAWLSYWPITDLGPLN